MSFKLYYLVKLSGEREEEEEEEVKLSGERGEKEEEVKLSFPLQRQWMFTMSCRHYAWFRPSTFLNCNVSVYQDVCRISCFNRLTPPCALWQFVLLL